MLREIELARSVHLGARRSVPYRGDSEGRQLGQGYSRAGGQSLLRVTDSPLMTNSVPAVLWAKAVGPKALLCVAALGSGWLTGW